MKISRQELFKASKASAPSSTHIHQFSRGHDISYYKYLLRCSLVLKLAKHRIK